MILSPFYVYINNLFCENAGVLTHFFFFICERKGWVRAGIQKEKNFKTAN